MMTWWMSLALATATPEPAEPAVVEASLNLEMWHVLSARHAPACDRVSATSDDAVADLLRIVDEVTMPPWAPMRAADCLVREHAKVPVVTGALREWVVDPAHMGLARLVVTRIDALDPTLAVDLASRAWAADIDRPFLKRHLGRSLRPEVRAVVPRP